MPTAQVPLRRLKYAATINDEALPDSTDADFELAYIDIGNVDSQGRIHDIVNYRFEDAPSRARRMVRDGDIIISTVRTYLQAIAPVENPPSNLIVSTGFAVVRPSNLLDHRFCKYALRENKFLWEVESRSTGVSYPAINASDLGDIKVRLPEISTQRLIANYLDRETARIDGLIAEKEHMLALLEEKRAALISRVVTRGLDPNAPLKPSGQEWLGEIPAHWRLERLKFHLSSLEQGWSPQCDNHPAEPDEWGVLKVGAVNAWTFNPAENKRLPDEIEPLREYEIKQHDVLMSRANTTQLLGSVVCVEAISSRLLLCDKLYRLNVNQDQLDREFLVAFLRASPGRFQLEREASGTSGSMQNIGQDTVQNAWIAVPPLAEQKTISRFIADSRKKTENMDAALRRTVDLLRERRAALITAAVTGQIPLEKMHA